MTEKRLLSRCEGYAVRIDERVADAGVIAKLQAPVIDEALKMSAPVNGGARGYPPGRFLVPFWRCKKEPASERGTFLLS